MSEIQSNMAIGHPQLAIGKGLDHYFVTADNRGQLRPFARLEDPVSGRRLDVLTTEQGGQIYSGNYLNTSVIGKRGIAYQPFQGICLETGQFPDAPNQKNFPTLLLTADKPFYSKTRWQFSSH